MATPLFGPPSFEGDPGVRVGAARVSRIEPRGLIPPQPAKPTRGRSASNTPGASSDHACPRAEPDRLTRPPLLPVVSGSFRGQEVRLAEAARSACGTNPRLRASFSAGPHPGSGCWLDRSQPAPRRRSWSGESSQQAADSSIWLRREAAPAHWKPRSTGPRLR
jgi:hypothetical protein